MRIATLPLLGVMIFAVSFAVAQNAAPPQPKPASAPSALPAATSDSEDVALGEPFEAALPKYPKDALRARLQGAVVLVLSVDEEGYVTKGSAISGDPQLVEAALGVVRKWKYVPYDVNEQPVAVTTKVTFVFSMSEAGHPDVSVTVRNQPKTELGPGFQAGHGVTAPKPIYSPDPQYSKQAKKEKY